MDKTSWVEYAGHKFNSHSNSQFNVFYEVLTEFFYFIDLMADHNSYLSKNEFAFSLILAWQYKQVEHTLHDD